MNENHGNSLDEHVIDLFKFSVPILVLVLRRVCAIVRLTLTTIFDETTVWVAILSSTVGYILPFPKL